MHVPGPKEVGHIFKDTMEKTQPTESQIQVLMSDWLGNLRMKAEGNYTHKGKGGIRVHKDTSIRQYLMGDTRGMDTLELMKRSRMAAENIINGVTPLPVTVQVGGADSYHAETRDGRQVINIATDYFDDNTISKNEKADIMLGLASHEAAHAAYTDSSLTEEHIGKEDKRLQELKHNIWNIIEDERIEYHLGEDRPGLSECIGATKGYYFDKLIQKMKTNGKMPTEPLPKLLSAITLGVRYPSEMTRQQVEENFDELDAVRRALTPYPLTPEDAWQAADRVMDIIRQKAEEQLNEEKQHEQDNEKNNDENLSDQQQNPGDGSSAPGGESDGNQSQSQSGSPSREEITQAIEKAMSTEQGKNVMDAIKNEIEKSDGSNMSSAISEERAEEFVNEDDSERMSAYGAGGGSPRIFVRKPKGNATTYNAYLKKVQKYVPAMSRVLSCKSQEKDYVLRSQRRGKLDMSKLVAYKAGSEDIFKKSGSVKCSSASVCMLIDESGSMYGLLQETAREAAILVNEAIKRIRNVNFYCYGFTTERLNVYSENRKTSPFALSDTKADGGTPTGEAMKLCAQRIRRFTQEPIIMLVMTDGAACDPQQVIAQDKLLRTNKIFPVGVGILTNTVESTFRDSIVFTDMSKFPIEMGKLTKNKLDKLMVRTDTND